MHGAVASHTSTSRMGRVLARVEQLPDDLRALFHATIVRGEPKAAACVSAQIDGEAFDQRYARLLRELKRDPSRVVLPQVPRLRFPFPPKKL
ncbi:hypothetical protein RA8P2_00035 (plasmid) [Variovorax sp. RA8]|nr:hypothetical protein RA8P2_00035 [Variovorax sp. RA8]